MERRFHGFSTDIHGWIFRCKVRSGNRPDCRLQNEITRLNLNFHKIV